MRTWDVYDNKSQLEVLQHSHDVLALAWRPDGKQLASATLDGQIYFWNAQVGNLGIRWLFGLFACGRGRSACALEYFLRAFACRLR